MDELFGVVHVILVVDEVHEGFSSRRIISEGRLMRIVVTRGYGCPVVIEMVREVS